MRRTYALALALSIAMPAVAQAEEWCGYAASAKAVIECGYTTVAGCENAVGKGGMCFADPDLALATQRQSSSRRAPG